MINLDNMPPKEESLPPELQHKAALIRESPLFVGISGEGQLQKQTLFLVLAGAKPVGEALSAHRVRAGNTGHAVADDPKQVAAFLDSLGLAYDLTDSDETVTQALVSLNPDLLEQYRLAEEADDVATIGRLFGYPETALAAFAAGQSALLADDTQALESAGLDRAAVPFYLSKDHWQEELQAATHWQVLLDAAGLRGTNEPAETS